MKQRNCWPGEAGSQGQMELGFGGNPAREPRSCRRTQRFNRAQWWFSRMRQVVDHALDRPGNARPVQESLPGTDLRADGKD